MDLSIIVVNWNTREILRDCLRSIEEQTEGIQYEILVVDNASSDCSVEMVRREFPDVRIIENFENKGFAAANNQGIRIAKGRYYLLLNSDTIVLDGAIQKAVAFADQHPDAGMAGCMIVNPDLSLQRSCFMAPSLLNLALQASYLNQLFPRNKFCGRERMTWWDHNEVREVQAVMGAFMLARREAVEAVGMMDEDYFMYAEETDWCCRFRKRGWLVLFTPDAEIIHLGGQSSKQVRARSLIQLRLGILLFFYKNRSRLAFYLAGFLIFAFFTLRIPLWTVSVLMRLEDQEQRARLQAYWTGAGKVIKAMLNPSVETFKA